MKITIKFIQNILEKFNLIANLTTKNLALHQQLIVLNRSIKRPQIKTKDRLFWIILYLFWNNWQESFKAYNLLDIGSFIFLSKTTNDTQILN